MIELLVVITITALIATVSLANYRHGEKSRRVAFASDGLIGVFKNAQTYALSGKATNNSNPLCRVAARYYVSLNYSDTYSLKAINNCG